MSVREQVLLPARREDGKHVDVGPPPKPSKRQNADGDLNMMQRYLLYDFLEERNGRLVLPLEFLDILDFLTDSDDDSDFD